MSRWAWKSMRVTLKQLLWNTFLIFLGSVICCLGIKGILLPHQFLGAGFTGISLILYYLIPSIPLSISYFALNIPLFAIALLYVGRRFFFYSILGMVIFSLALAYPIPVLPIQDKILASLMAGIFIGTGSGIILRSLGSAGGLDILSVILLKRFSVRLGTTILAFNIVLLVAGAFLFSLELALYTLIYLFVSSNIVDIVVTGMSQRKAVYIISLKWDDIYRRIMDEMRRGVTIIRGQGGYSGQEEQILFTVISLRELPQLKKLIHGSDPNAFVVVTNTLEVMGHRIGNQPHW
ncbi:MAG: YitT family protein [ANME-2 cluster archaeon]|nr:MAG: YitT family protein [ANME-2 cluster archaeon]